MQDPIQQKLDDILKELKCLRLIVDAIANELGGDEDEDYSSDDTIEDAPDIRKSARFMAQSRK